MADEFGQYGGALPRKVYSNHKSNTVLKSLLNNFPSLSIQLYLAFCHDSLQKSSHIIRYSDIKMQKLIHKSSHINTVKNMFPGHKSLL